MHGWPHRPRSFPTLGQSFPCFHLFYSLCLSVLSLFPFWKLQCGPLLLSLDRSCRFPSWEDVLVIFLSFVQGALC